jgi:hypothetical protein
MTRNVCFSVVYRCAIVYVIFSEGVKESCAVFSPGRTKLEPEKILTDTRKKKAVPNHFNFYFGQKIKQSEVGVDLGSLFIFNCQLW